MTFTYTMSHQRPAQPAHEIVGIRRVFLQRLWTAFSRAHCYCKTMAMGAFCCYCHRRVHLDPCIMALYFYSFFYKRSLCTSKVCHSLERHSVFLTCKRIRSLCFVMQMPINVSNTIQKQSSDIKTRWHPSMGPSCLLSVSIQFVIYQYISTFHPNTMPCSMHPCSLKKGKQKFTICLVRLDPYLCLSEQPIVRAPWQMTSCHREKETDW